MLDIKLIRDDVETFKERIKTRGGDAYELFDQLIAFDEVRRRCETEKQHLQGERNSKSKLIGQKKKAGEDTTELETEVRAIGGKIKAVGEEADHADEK